MSSWYEEKPSQEFRKRIEHRASQMIDNRTQAVTRRASWTLLFRIATGLSVATVAGVLIARRNSSQSGVDSEIGHLIPDALAIDLLEESPDLDLLADLELLESFDDLLEVSDDDFTEEKV